MIEPPKRAAAWRRILYVGLAVLLVVELARLGGQLQKRVTFPWDLLTCFESPHLAALMKLYSGEPLYGPATDANSEPYTPLTAQLTYVVLKPLGLELDIRGARGVAVGFTLVTAGIAAWLVRRLLLTADVAARAADVVTPLVAAAAFLMLHRSMTSDQPHPDNLHILHATTLLLLLTRAATTDRLAPWIAAALWASLGFLTKQTAALAPAAVVLTVICHRSLAWRARLAIAGLTVTVAVVIAWWQLSDPSSDFHLRRVLAVHARDWSRLRSLYTDRIPLKLFPRWALAATAATGFVWAWRTTAVRPFLAAWCAVGFFEALPGVAGFIKAGGNYNNLGVLDFWLFLLATPVAIGLALQATGLRAVVAAATCGWFVAALWPIKLVPNEHSYRLGRDVELRVQADIAAGRNVWLTAGLMFRIRAGDVRPPQDLGIALWTLAAARQVDHDGEAAHAWDEGVEARLKSGTFDRIYFFYPANPLMFAMLPAKYERIDTIKGAGYGTHEEYRGMQLGVNGATVYERRKE